MDESADAHDGIHHHTDRNGGCVVITDPSSTPPHRDWRNVKRPRQPQIHSLRNDDEDEDDDGNGGNDNDDGLHRRSVVSVERPSSYIFDGVNSDLNFGHRDADIDHGSIYSPSPKRMKFSILSQEEVGDRVIDIDNDQRITLNGTRGDLFTGNHHLTTTTIITTLPQASMSSFSSPSAVSCTSALRGINCNDYDETTIKAINVEDKNKTNGKSEGRKEGPMSSSSSSSSLEWWKRPQTKQDHGTIMFPTNGRTTKNLNVMTSLNGTCCASTTTSTTSTDLLQCHICRKSFPKTPSRSVKNVMKPNALLQYFSYKKGQSSSTSSSSSSPSSSYSSNKNELKTSPKSSVASSHTKDDGWTDSVDRDDTCHRCYRSCCVDCRSFCVDCQQVTCGFCCIPNNRQNHGGVTDHDGDMMMDCDDDDDDHDIHVNVSSCAYNDNDDGMVCWDCASRR